MIIYILETTVPAVLCTFCQGHAETHSHSGSGNRHWNADCASDGSKGAELKVNDDGADRILDGYERTAVAISHCC